MIDGGRGPGRRHAGSDRGQATLEYLGTTALVVLLIIAVAAAVLQFQAGSFVARALCMITRQAVCPVDPYVSPYQRAVSGRYVAMGDSFASGEGAWDYEEGTDYEDGSPLNPNDNETGDHNRCHRSANAYARIVSTGNAFAGGTSFVACSGAVTQHFENPNDKNTGEDPQLAALDDGASLVTLSIGGNDLQFADVLAACVTSNLVPSGGDCRKQFGGRIAEKLPQLRADLVALYQKVRIKAPNARVIVVGYPPLFPASPKPSYRNLLRAQDQAWMNERAADFNAVIKSAAQEAGVEFVDPTVTFRGHGLGSEDSWFNDLHPIGAGPSVPNASTFHPNARGQDAFARLIQQQLENPR